VIAGSSLNLYYVGDLPPANIMTVTTQPFVSGVPSNYFATSCCLLFIDLYFSVSDTLNINGFVAPAFASYQDAGAHTWSNVPYVPGGDDGHLFTLSATLFHVSYYNTSTNMITYEPDSGGSVFVMLTIPGATGVLTTTPPAPVPLPPAIWLFGSVL